MSRTHFAADQWAHSVAFVAAVVLHTPLLFITQSRQRSTAPHPTMTIIIRLDIQQPAQRASEQSTTRLRDVAGSAARAVNRVRSRDQPESRSHDPPSAGVDWEMAGAIAAQSAIESLVRAEGYRELGPRAAKTPGPPEPPSVFETPKHRSGDVEPDPLNYDRVWHNDRCYTELGKPVTPRADARIGNVSPPKCWIGIGKKKARGDLFDHLKRDKPPP